VSDYPKVARANIDHTELGHLEAYTESFTIRKATLRTIPTCCVSQYNQTHSAIKAKLTAARSPTCSPQARGVSAWASPSAV
jgi:hypothetical protein